MRRVPASAKLAAVDRYWLVTFTTYGTWLPGDRRGSVTRVRDQATAAYPRAKRNTPGTPAEPPMPALEHYAALAMRAGPVLLNQRQAGLLLPQFHETARYRGWSLPAVAIMRNHVHVVVGVNGDPEPSTLLRDLKSYGSRALNADRGGAPRRWWTASGSHRRLADEAAVVAAMRYVRDQVAPLVVWVDPTAPVGPIGPRFADE